MKKWFLVLLLSLGVVTTASADPSGVPIKYGKHLCDYKKHFKCVTVKKGDTWKKMFPDKKERFLIQRLNRTNMSIQARPWIVVPLALKNFTYWSFAPFPRSLKTVKGKAFLLIDLKELAFGAFDATGQLLYWGPISGGKNYCKDTKESCRTVIGHYKITRKQGKDCASSKFPLATRGGAPMPYCMHFHKGFAIHAGKLPAHHASHGCVRLFEEDAKWLNHHFAEIGTPVVVKSY